MMLHDLSVLITFFFITQENIQYLLDIQQIFVELIHLNFKMLHNMTSKVYQQLRFSKKSKFPQNHIMIPIK